MSEPSEIRSRFQPARYMTQATAASTTGTEVDTTSPARHPRLTKQTASTITSASRNERSNSHTDSSTTRGWSAMSLSSSPAGSVASMAAMRCCRRVPNVRMLPSRVIVTPMASAGAPLWRIVYCAGSSYPCRTSAISPIRSSWPCASSGTARMSSRLRNAPLVRSRTRSPCVSTLPAGASAFCRDIASNTALIGIPSATSLRCEISTYTFSGCLPSTSTLATIGTSSSCRLICSAWRFRSAKLKPSPCTTHSRL